MVLIYANESTFFNFLRSTFSAKERLALKYDGLAGAMHAYYADIVKEILTWLNQMLFVISLGSTPHSIHIQSIGHFISVRHDDTYHIERKMIYFIVGQTSAICIFSWKYKRNTIIMIVISCLRDLSHTTSTFACNTIIARYAQIAWDDVSPRSQRMRACAQIK